MKIIFLDIDGVLNSDAYDRVRGENDSNIDESRLDLLKKAVQSTNAKIVLSSTWRKHWSKLESERTPQGNLLHYLFSKHQLEIYDKTPVLGKIYDRKQEIQLWLSSQEKEIEKFVILDDLPFGWGEFGDFLIKTNGRIGRGLEEEHIQKIISILNG